MNSHIFLVGESTYAMKSGRAYKYNNSERNKKGTHHSRHPHGIISLRVMMGKGGRNLMPLFPFFPLFPIVYRARECLRVIGPRQCANVPIVPDGLYISREEGLREAA